MKKMFFASLILIGAAALFANGASENAASGSKTIKVVYKEPGGNEAMTKWMTQAKADFEAQNPGVTVELSTNLSNEADYNTKSALMLQSDDSIDVIHVDSFLVPAIVSSGLLAPIPTENWPDYDSQFVEGVKEGMKIDGETYSISFTTDTRGLYYNIPVFEKAGIPLPFAPKNWNDILDAVKKLDEAGIAYPIWFTGSKAQGEGTTMQTFEMLISGTEDWIFEDGKWVASAPGITDSLKFIQALHDMAIYDNNELATMLDSQAWQVLNDKMPKSEEVGIALDGNWKGGDFKGYEDAISIAPMPKQKGHGFTSMSGGWTLAISEMSKNKDLALQFISVACSKENLLKYVNISGDMATRKDIASDESYIANGHFRSAMTPYAEFTHFRPGNDAYPSVSIEIQAAVEAVITGQLTAEQAAAQYASNIKDLVGEGNWIEK